MVVCVTIMFLFVRSRFGRTVQAIREDYIARLGLRLSTLPITRC